MKKQQDKKFGYVALIVFVLALVIGYFIEIKIAMMVMALLLLILGIIIYKKRVSQELIIAFLLALALTSYYQYTYTSFNIFFGKINLFPLISWTFGLVLLKEVYKRVNIKKYKFLIISLIYLGVLFLLEYIGYYILGIKLASNFPCLFNTGVIYGPVGMKFFYVFAGPVYLLITDYLGIK